MLGKKLMVLLPFIKAWSLVWYLFEEFPILFLPNKTLKNTGWRFLRGLDLWGFIKLKLVLKKHLFFLKNCVQQLHSILFQRNIILHIKLLTHVSCKDLAEVFHETNFWQYHLRGVKVIPFEATFLFDPNLCQTVLWIFETEIHVKRNPQISIQILYLLKIDPVLGASYRNSYGGW